MPLVFHHSALPWRWHDKYESIVTLRIQASVDVDEVTLLYGDPYDWTGPSNPGSGPTRWNFAEQVMGHQFSGSDTVIWRTAIPVPKYRRLKYGFRLKTVYGQFYYSENGVQAYTQDAVNRIPYNHFSYPFIHTLDSPNIPSWAQDTVWYEIFPERFRNGNPAISPAGSEDWETGKPELNNFFGGDLAGIRSELPYLSDLGINGIYLTPIFPSPSNHKYNIQDYYAVDEQFGDLGELKALIAEAHERGIRVMLDAVFNHAGESHPFWQDVLKNQEQSPYRDYFHIHRFPVKSSYSEKYAMDFDAFGFYPNMPKWNTENPAVRKYLLEAAAYWIREADIDGWRLDVANEVSLDFWKDFSRSVRSLKEDFYIVGEVWFNASTWIHSGCFDAAMNYPLNSAVSDFFLEKKIDALQFTEKLFAVLSRYSDIHNREAFNLLDSHDTDRALTRARGDKQALRNAFTMLSLLPGSPCIYYGTEIGMEGGNDPDCRRPMVWDENKQDLELKEFFKALMGFRKKYAPIIRNNIIEYREEEGFHYWVFSGENETLTAIYAEGSAPSGFTAPGRIVFSTGNPTGANAGGELAPHTLTIFFQSPVSAIYKN
ncbi:glycoside hydrolase family 13 protein [Treponema primitia]|uniref:glycoside hydrolase family 13 protein n=1 Tax=Treponema primitia TaxID=88058 RepID=UPI00145D185D|nr:glycoside hydrolase family 13 protein [Treponema primitia]